MKKNTNELRPVYSTKKFHHHDANRTFTLAEHLEDTREKEWAKYVYASEGYYVKVERDRLNKVYYVYTRKGRKKKPTPLTGEIIKRTKVRKLQLV